MNKENYIRSKILICTLVCGARMPLENLYDVEIKILVSYVCKFAVKWNRP